MNNTTSMKNMSSMKMETFYNEHNDGLIYLSHASILINLNSKKYLFDPVLAKPPHLGSWLFFPEMVIDRRLLEVDAVFVSHQHQDHYDIDFLKMLPKSTPIYIVSGRPQFSSMLENEGIKYIELPANELIDLGNDVTCLGINHEYNGIDAAIAISNGNFTVYHGNDCFVSNEKLTIVKNIYPKINVACIPFAYVHWYPFLLEEVDETWKKKEADRLINEYLDYGLRQIEYLQPDIAIPFGANMFYFDDFESEHNKAVLSPFDFKKYANDKKFEFNESIFTLFSGDRVSSLNNMKSRELYVHQKKFFYQDLIDEFNAYFKHMQKNGTGFDSTSIEALTYKDIEDTTFIVDRLKNARKSLCHSIYISNIDAPNCRFVEIDLNSMTVNRRNEIDNTKIYHHFKLTEFAYKAYFSKKYTFNEIVASSRFKLTRNPNEYNLDVLKIINNVL